MSCEGGKGALHLVRGAINKHGHLALFVDGYLLRLERTGLNISVPVLGAGFTPEPTSGVNLLTGFIADTVENGGHITRYSNTDPGEWAMHENRLLFKALDGYVDLNMEVRLTGTMAGVGPGSYAEATIATVRPVGGVMTIAAERGFFNVGTLNAKSVMFGSYTHEAIDPYSTDGLAFYSRNTTASAMTITGIVILIKGVRFA